MNDVFLSVTDSDTVDNNGDATDASRQTLLACQKCFEEFSLICEECDLEMSHRDPVVMSNCRDFMHRYASLFMSRITLELSWYLGKDKLSNSDDVSDVFVIESIKFTHSIDSIKHYQFLPRSLFIGLRENLQTYDQLSKFLSNLLLDRNEAWFKELDELQPRQRGYKLREFYKIVNFQVDKIHTSFYLSDKDDVDTKSKLIMSTINTMVFSLAKYVKCLDFSNYGEEALLEHILACQEIVKFCYGLKVYPYSGKINSQSATENFGVDPTKFTKQWVIALRDHELEVLSTTFLTSADTAAASAVKNTFQTFEDIRKMFFYEKAGMGWIGGKVCELYLGRVTTWMVAFCQRASATPCEFHRIAIRETIRMVVYSYIKGLCDRYKNDKKFILSENGSQQLASDLHSIMTWVDTQNVKLIPPTIKNKSEYKGCNDLTMLLRNIRMFVTSDESSLLFCLSEAIQHFGTASSLHIYDLARLCLKIRDDMSNSTRKYVLGLFSTYVEQLQRASLEEFGPLSKSHPRLSGPALLSDLFPRVGSLHCSGKKWSLEKLLESETDARLDIANLVTDACNISRIRRAGVTKEAKDAIRKQSSFRNKRQSCGVDEMASLRTGLLAAVDPDDDTSSSELWQLLDPSYVETSAETSDTIGVGDKHGYADFNDDEVQDDSGCHARADQEGGSDKDDYELADERPFVDLHGCTFEELHHTLRPKVYTKTTFAPVCFVNNALTARRSSSGVMASPRSSSLMRSSLSLGDLGDVIYNDDSDDDYVGDDDDDDVDDDEAGEGDDDNMILTQSDRKSGENVSGVNRIVEENIIAETSTTAAATCDNSTAGLATNTTTHDDSRSRSRTSESERDSERERESLSSENTAASVVPPKKPPKPRRYSHVEGDA
jgi:hypothetical protein